MSPVAYNRRALGRLWTLADLPVEWPGYEILLHGDLDSDRVIDEEELEQIDWIAFSEAVGDFQRQAGVEPADSKLGPLTLERLQSFWGMAERTVLRQIGDLALPPAEVPVAPPPGPPLVGRNAEERRLCALWNNYGAAIHQRAAVLDLPVRTALAVFAVESGQAYDPTTGLLIIRFEPHIFRRKSGRPVSAERGGQAREWDNFERAYQIHPEATLLSCSYGLPQLMGFNWDVTTHSSPRALVLAFQRSCIEQVAGFFGFVQKRGLTPLIENQDWRGFTRRYNGPGNVDVYSGRLIRALKVVDTLVQDGAELRIEG